MKSKGIALILVLGFIMVAVVMANIAVVLIRSQYRLTHHQVSRVQAFYAAQAGINYALEMLRTGDWPTGALPETHDLCRGCVAPDVDEPDLPLSIQNVVITVGDDNGDGTLEVSAKAIYTYQ